MTQRGHLSRKKADRNSECKTIMVLGIFELLPKNIHFHRFCFLTLLTFEEVEASRTATRAVSEASTIHLTSLLLPSPPPTLTLTHSSIRHVVLGLLLLWLPSLSVVPGPSIRSPGTPYLLRVLLHQGLSTLVASSVFCVPGVVCSLLPCVVLVREEVVCFPEPV